MSGRATPGPSGRSSYQLLPLAAIALALGFVTIFYVLTHFPSIDSGTVILLGVVMTLMPFAVKGLWFIDPERDPSLLERTY